ncbi:MAG: hypothetical protein KAI47_04155 [Deltaproteobacteria bacterium]|nr:hypothetical protein [Deltaproteobacteria bacterium]
MFRSQAEPISRTSHHGTLFTLGIIATVTLGCGTRSPVASQDGAIFVPHDIGITADHPRDIDIKDIYHATEWSAFDVIRFPDAARADVMPQDGLIPQDGPPCFCPNLSDVQLIGACVPTRDLTTCVPSCDPNDPKTCPGAQYTDICDPNAATPNCITSSTRPACVPGPKDFFSPGTLRIQPTTGKAGSSVKLTISGGKLQDHGPNSWRGRMGQTKPSIVSLNSTWGSCVYHVTLVPPAPGIYAVEIATGLSGGGGGGSSTWSLAGFYGASGGVPFKPTAQPGEVCSSQMPCAEAPPYQCACLQGRCACKR